jgi:CheY-like chemotaxis protein
MDIHRPDFRVIAEGDDAVGTDLTLFDALVLLDSARLRGKRHVAIVDDTTGALVDERTARTWVLQSASPRGEDTLVPCPACEDEGGVPTGDVLVQLPSGTWIRDTCEVCQGQRMLDRRQLDRRSPPFVDESGGAAASADPRDPRIASGTRPRIGRVLVVDDDPRFVELLRLVLSGEFEVRGTTDPWQALAWMTGGDWYDVVLCDVTMPAMTGLELRDRVHEALPEMAARMVFMTGMHHERVRRLVEAGPHTCLEKPLDLASLRDLIRRGTLPGEGEDVVVWNGNIGETPSRARGSSSRG